MFPGLVLFLLREVFSSLTQGILLESWFGFIARWAEHKVGQMQQPDELGWFFLYLPCCPRVAWPRLGHATSVGDTQGLRHMMPGTMQHSPVSPGPSCHLPCWEGRNSSCCSGNSSCGVKSACNVKSKNWVICRTSFSSQWESQRSAGMGEILKAERSSVYWPWYRHRGMAMLAPKCDFKLSGIKGLFLDLVKLKTSCLNICA